MTVVRARRLLYIKNLYRIKLQIHRTLKQFRNLFFLHKKQMNGNAFGNIINVYVFVVQSNLSYVTSHGTIQKWSHLTGSFKI